VTPKTSFGWHGQPPNSEGCRAVALEAKADRACRPFLDPYPLPSVQSAVNFGPFRAPFICAHLCSSVVSSLSFARPHPILPKIERLGRPLRLSY